MTILEGILLASLAAFGIFGAVEAEYVIVATIAVYSTIFYYLVLTVLIGINDIVIDSGSSLTRIWQIRLTMLIGYLLIYMQGYTEVFYYALPFVLISVAGDIVSSLVLTGHIGWVEYDEDGEAIIDEEDEPEDDEEDEPEDDDEEVK